MADAITQIGKPRAKSALEQAVELANEEPYPKPPEGRTGTGYVNGEAVDIPIADRPAAQSDPISVGPQIAFPGFEGYTFPTTTVAISGRIELNLAAALDRMTYERLRLGEAVDLIISVRISDHAFGVKFSKEGEVLPEKNASRISVKIPELSTLRVASS